MISLSLKIVVQINDASKHMNVQPWAFTEESGNSLFDQHLLGFSTSQEFGNWLGWFDPNTSRLPADNKNMLIWFCVS